MAKDDQQEAYEKISSASLSRIIEFIKFAEAKNAALLTFCSAWIIAILNLLASDKVLPDGYRTALSISIPLFVISAVMAILSFAPRIRLSVFDKAKDRQKNLLFFGDIADLSLVEFKSQVHLRYMPQENKYATDEFFSDLATQIRVNSEIAGRKFGLFNWASRIVLLAVIVLSAPSACHIATLIRSLFK